MNQRAWKNHLTETRKSEVKLPHLVIKTTKKIEFLFIHIFLA